MPGIAAKDVPGLYWAFIVPNMRSSPMSNDAREMPPPAAT